MSVETGGYSPVPKTGFWPLTMAHERVPVYPVPVDFAPPVGETICAGAPIILGHDPAARAYAQNLENQDFIVNPNRILGVAAYFETINGKRKRFLEPEDGPGKVYYWAADQHHFVVKTNFAALDIGAQDYGSVVRLADNLLGPNDDNWEAVGGNDCDPIGNSKKIVGINNIGGIKVYGEEAITPVTNGVSVTRPAGMTLLSSYPNDLPDLQAETFVVVKFNDSVFSNAR